MKTVLSTFILSVFLTSAFAQVSINRKPLEPLHSFQTINDLSIADFDNDGDQDMLVNGISESSIAGVYLFENIGDSMVATNMGFNRIDEGSTDWGDLDVIGLRYHFFKTYLNDNTGSFTVEDNGMIDQGIYKKSGEVNITAFPNPAGEEFNLHIRSKTAENLELIITNVSGETVYRENIKNAHNYSGVIDAEDWSSGVYSLHIISEKWKETLMLMKK